MELWDAYKSDGTILLMQRDKDKPNYPGYWKVSGNYQSTTLEDVGI